MAEEFDLIVVGSGPGGYVGAIRAAQLGNRTAIIERDHIGGRCLNKACIPAKAVLRSADILSEVREASEFGIEVAEPTVDHAKIAERRESVISTLVGGVSGLMKKNSIEVIEGSGVLTGPGAIKVGDRELTAKRIILDTFGCAIGGHTSGPAQIAVMYVGMRGVASKFHSACPRSRFVGSGVGEFDTTCQ